jgi:hypothetical protein
VIARRRRNRYVLIAVVSVVVVATLVAAVMFFLKRPAKPPVAQPVACPDVMVVSIPGTWESSAQLDPLNPTEFPNALLLNVTRPLTEQFQGGRMQVYTSRRARSSAAISPATSATAEDPSTRSWCSVSR